MCNLSIESIYISHFRFPKSHFHISCENEIYLQEVEKLFSHQYFDLIFIFVKRAALQIFCKKSSALCFALVLKIFMFFVIRASLLPYSGDFLNICGNNFAETSKWKHICLH